MYGLLRLAIAATLCASLCSCGSFTDGEPPGLGSAAATPAGPVQKGTLRRWPEATMHLRVDTGTAVASAELAPTRPEGMSAFWSIASTQGPGSGFFYATDGCRVAHATSAHRVQDIRDASAFDYSRPSVGPVPVGGIVLVHHAASTRYLAIVVDAIEPTDPRSAGAGPYAYADVTWYLADEGSSNLSAAP